MCVFFFRQKTAYEMRISDWSSDVCSSDLAQKVSAPQGRNTTYTPSQRHPIWYAWSDDGAMAAKRLDDSTVKPSIQRDASGLPLTIDGRKLDYGPNRRLRSEEHTSELQSLMRTSSAVFRLKYKRNTF